LRSYSNHTNINLQLYFYLRVLQWPEDDHLVDETRPLIHRIKKMLVLMVINNYLVTYII